MPYGWGGYSDYSDPYSEDPFGFGSLFGDSSNRFKLSSDPKKEMDSAFTKSVQDDDLKKARKDKWMNVVSILPALAQIFASKDSANVASALQNIQDIMEHRRDVLAKQQEEELERAHETGLKREEFGFRREERIGSQEFQAGEGEKERGFQEKLEGKKQKFQLDLTESEHKWQAIRDETEMKFQEKMKRMGIYSEASNSQRQTRVLLGNQFKAAGLGIQASEEASSILSMGGSFSDLSTETQLAINLVDEVQKAKTGAEMQQIGIERLNAALKVRVPMLEEDGSIKRDPLKGFEYERPIIAADILDKLDPSWAAGVFGLDKILPPSDIPAGAKGGGLDTTVAGANLDTSTAIGLDLLKNPEMQKRVKQIGETGNLSNAAAYGKTVYEYSGGNAATAFSLIDNLTSWTPQMKEAARQAVRELERQKSVGESMGGYMQQQQ